jgi:hypothetical protein
MMPKIGLFALPTEPESYCGTVRAAYREAFNHEWPYDDDYLRELAKEVPPNNAAKKYGGRCRWLIELMRETDDTPQTLVDVNT